MEIAVLFETDRHRHIDSELIDGTDDIGEDVELRLFGQLHRCKYERHSKPRHPRLVIDGKCRYTTQPRNRRRRKRAATTPGAALQRRMLVQTASVATGNQQLTVRPAG